MPKTIYAQDHEFAASSGANIRVTDEYSYFDHPPNSTMDLTITSNLGDDHPFRFDLGDTYDLTWAGHGGGIMDNAVVIRSDYVGPGQGAVVFEGINSITGEPFQMVWSPGFDLEEWYWANGGGPSSPNAFWTSDQNANETVQVICYAAGTLIACAQGQVRVEDLRLGDRVATADNGYQPIRFIRRKQQSLRKGAISAKPILIAAGALGDGFPARNLVVSQNHRLLLGGGQYPLSGTGPGTGAEVFAPAKALLGLPKIRYLHGWQQVTWVHFAFDRHEVVFANGARSESLLPGPMAMQGLGYFERDILARSLATGLDTTIRSARPCLSVGAIRRHFAGRPGGDDRHIAEEVAKWDADLAAGQTGVSFDPAILHRQRVA